MNCEWLIREINKYGVERKAASGRKHLYKYAIVEGRLEYIWPKTLIWKLTN
jgi:hypothetical protein